MNHLRLHAPGPAQRAAGEIRNTLNGVADEVREMNSTVDALRATVEAPRKPAPPVEHQTEEEARPAELKSGLPQAEENRPDKDTQAGTPVPPMPALDEQTTEDAPVEEIIVKPPPGDQQEATAPESPLAQKPSVTPLPEERTEERAGENKNSEMPPPGMGTVEVAPAPNGKLAHYAGESAHQGDPAFPQPAAADRALPDPAGASALHPPPSTDRPELVIPPVPDLRPHLEAFVNKVVSNQQQIIGMMEGALKVLSAQSAQIAGLKQQIDQQQNAVGNMRRF